LSDDFDADVRKVLLDYVLALLWGCHSLIKLGNAKHHPQKRHIPRQAGRVALIMGY